MSLCQDSDVEASDYSMVDQSSVTASRRSADGNAPHKKVTQCRVCGDVSSGRHYGVFTCDGCSGFFMRSVRRKVMYSCKGNGHCIVDKKRRNQCQACRFAKCVDVKMNRYAVQQERQPSSSRIQGSPISVGLPVYDMYSPPRGKYTSGCLRTDHMLGATTGFDGTGFPEYLSSGTCSTSHRYPVVGPQSPLANCRSSHVNTEDVYDATARIMFWTVKWARSIPAFSEISYRDQVSLLDASWRDVFILFALQWDLHFDVNALLSGFAASHPTSTDESIMANIKLELKHLQTLQYKFQSMKTTSEEYIFLKAIALFKPETRGINDPGYVEECQDQAQAMLCQQTRISGRDQSMRFGKFLLTLPSLQIVSKRTLEDVFFRSTIGSVSIEKILSDLLKKSP